jgi:hypothetical protein
MKEKLITWDKADYNRREREIRQDRQADLEDDRAPSVDVQKEHERQARQFAREQEIPYSPPELSARDKGVRIIGRCGPMGWIESREQLFNYLKSQREQREQQVDHGMER